MTERDKGMVRGFYWLSKAWYAKPIMENQGVYDELMIGYYAPDGDGGTTGEFAIVWELLGGKPVPQLRIFDDAWRLLAEWPDFVRLLAECNDRNILPEGMAGRLTELGFIDVTKRTH